MFANCGGKKWGMEVRIRKFTYCIFDKSTEKKNVIKKSARVCFLHKKSARVCFFSTIYNEMEHSRIALWTFDVEFGWYSKSVQLLEKEKAALQQMKNLWMCQHYFHVCVFSENAPSVVMTTCIDIGYRSSQHSIYSLFIYT